MNSKYFPIKLILILLFFSSINYGQTNWKSDFYSEVPPIVIIEKEGVKVGSLNPGDVLQINLTDIAQYTGHICPSVAAGFLLTKMALDELFPNETPERGNIRIAAMAPNDLVNVAAYVVGIRPADMLSENPDLIIDKGLKPEEKGKIVLLFQRKDSGKMVKAYFNKMELLTPEDKKTIMPYRKKYKEGKVTEEEIITTGKYIQTVVKRLVTNTPKGALVVKHCTDYKFPEIKE